MEQLDDIHLEETGRPVDVLQLKHHVGSGGSLTDESQDLWRTLVVWMDALPTLDPGDLPEFGLLTTSTAPADSIASLLRSGDARDAPKALRLLRRVSLNSTAVGTASAREKFAKLDPSDQERLVNAIVVRDEEPEIQDLDDQLRSHLTLSVRTEHLLALIESLKSWWYARSVAMLRHSESGVTVGDLLDRIHQLRDSYHPENLPFEYDLGDPTEADQTAYSRRLFIHQLRWVAASNAMLAVAIDEYHRAYANRSKWLRLGVVLSPEMDDYERRLVVEWRRYKAFADARISEATTEDEKGIIGLALWQDVSNAAVRIRPRFDDQNLTRGIYHDLADRPEVGWHPDFETRVHELLGSVA
jgi:hypothetical protein